MALTVWRAGAACFIRSSVLIGRISQPTTRLRFSTSSVALAEKLFTKKHEWILMNKDEGTVGITDYAQKALGDIVFAQLPDPGNEVSKGVECGALESVKAASEIYSPVTGTVIEKNIAAEEKPQLINKSCYKDGWLYKVHLSDPSELDALLKEKAYEDFVKSIQDEDH